MLCRVLHRYHATNGAAGQQMYREMVHPVVDRFCQGFNGCILAYGQTGSGKTYTMAGGTGSLQPQDAIVSSSSTAVLPQACRQLLDYVAGAKAVYDVQIKVSCWVFFCSAELTARGSKERALSGSGTAAMASGQPLC